MKLYEYQSKKLFDQAGIPIPKSRIIHKNENIGQLFHQFGGSVLLKAQVVTSGRGKAGGIRLVRTENEAEKILPLLINSNVHGQKVNKILAEELIDFNVGYSVGIYFDRRKGMPILRGSPSTKLWQNERSHQTPQREIFLSEIEPMIGIHAYKIRELAVSIGLDKKYWDEFIFIIKKLWDLFKNNDALIVEINPLAVQKGEGLISLGVKMEIDDNSLFRQPEIEECLDTSVFTEQENEAHKLGFSYLELDGEIGILSNGAGLGMTTIDMIEYFGGKPANFLDIGSGAWVSRTTSGLRLLSSDYRVKVIFINMFGGYTSCEKIAEGIIEQIKITQNQQPLIVRMAGNQSERGKQLLKENGVQTADTMREAVKFCVDLLVKIKK